MAGSYQCKFQSMKATDPLIPVFVIIDLSTALPIAEVETDPVTRDKFKTNPSGLADLLLREWVDKNDPEAVWLGATADFARRESSVPLTTSIGVPVNDARLYARWVMAHYLRKVDVVTKPDDPALRSMLVAWVAEHFFVCKKEPKEILPNPYRVTAIKVRIVGETLEDLIDLYIAEAEGGGFISAGSGFVGLVTLTRALNEVQVATL